MLKEIITLRRPKMNREEFFEWLSTCPNDKWFLINDDVGNITIKFEYEETSNAKL